MSNQLSRLLFCPQTSRKWKSNICLQKFLSFLLLCPHWPAYFHPGVDISEKSRGKEEEEEGQIAPRKKMKVAVPQKMQFFTLNFVFIFQQVNKCNQTNIIKAFIFETTQSPLEVWTLKSLFSFIRTKYRFPAFCFFFASRCLKVKGFPTEIFRILEPQNPLIDISVQN